MMKGKCNCGKKATAEYLIIDQKKNTARTMKFCSNCKPKHNSKDIQLIYGKP